jgi:uncharacterized protein with ParB-like and HNH nuclease domain
MVSIRGERDQQRTAGRCRIENIVNRAERIKKLKHEAGDNPKKKKELTELSGHFCENSPKMPRILYNMIYDEIFLIFLLKTVDFYGYLCYHISMPRFGVLYLELHY